jgi:eukaryotic-like serine/threonine-protein kinase
MNSYAETIRYNLPRITMSISPGQQLGSYEILSLLGKGGMGEVYRARDSKLNREVAIKILPEEFSQDRERVSRFLREAQSVAALNHTNIAAIYELAESQGMRFLVLELVEGETLAERLNRGALPNSEALTIAKQILEALEAAYEKGIVHRDLKPANVKITPDGKVKVLDFGLAKAREEVSSTNVALSNSPTAGLGATTPGIIMGTAAYMSPEQAKGFSVDHRSDLFSFGCVLYEMLTGRQAFAGDSISEILASVLKSDVDFTLLPSTLNPRTRELLRRCVEKNPKNRWHAAADLRVELESSMNAAVPAVPITSSRFGWKYAAIVIVVLALLGLAVDDFIQHKRETSAPRTVSKFAITVPLDMLSNFLSRVIAISPDGTQIVYQTKGKLLLRSIGDFDSKPIPGAEDTIATTTPTFSPDGRSVIYWSVARGGLVTIPTIGGTPLLVAPISSIGIFGINWTADGILFAEGRQLRRVAGNGGTMTVLSDGGSTALPRTFPKVLPGGKAILFATRVDGRVQIAVQTLDSDKPQILLEPPLDASKSNIDVHYVPTGHLIYGVGGTVFAVPFDLAQLKLTGNPVPVIPGVRQASTNELELSFSNNGTLIYLPGPQTATAQFDVALADRNGGVQPLKLPPRLYESVRLSADGKHVSFGIEDGVESNIWLYDLTRPNAPNRLTFGGKNHFPVWSPDGQWIAFTSDREGDFAIFRQRADGTGVAERLTKPEKNVSHVPESWSPKGDVLLFRTVEGSNVSLWSLTLSDKKTAPFGDVKSPEPTNAVFSPDGKWVAYNIREAGKPTQEVFVQPFPATGARYQLPIGRDNHHPAWSRDGKQLFYVPGPGEVAAIPVTTTPAFTFGTPTAMPSVLENYAPAVPRQYDVTPDGKLIGLIPAGQSESGSGVPTHINVILNWFEELKQKVPSH